MRLARLRAPLVSGCLGLLLFAGAPLVDAQDRFEVQVFPDETMGRGGTEVEFHSVFIPSGTTLPGGPDPSTHAHLSVEVTHGWTDWFETGVEYALFKNPGDEAFRHALAIMPILERHAGRINLTFNPAIDVAVRGPESGSAPVFEPSASFSAQIFERLRIACEYYAETGSIKRFEPVSEQHHLIVPSVDLAVSPRLELNIGVGRGLTGISEHWIVKSILSYRVGP